MKNYELIDYLRAFPEDTDVSLIAANPVAREYFLIKDVFFVMDKQIDHPVICIEISQTKEMDEEIIKICEEDEQRNESE